MSTPEDIVTEEKRDFRIRNQIGTEFFKAQVVVDNETNSLSRINLEHKNNEMLDESLKEAMGANENKKIAINLSDHMSLLKVHDQVKGLKRRCENAIKKDNSANYQKLVSYKKYKKTYTTTENLILNEIQKSNKNIGNNNLIDHFVETNENETLRENAASSNELKGMISAWNSSVTEIKADIIGIKTDISQTKTDIAGINLKIDENQITIANIWNFSRNKSNTFGEYRIPLK